MGPFEQIELGVITIKGTNEGPEGHRSPAKERNKH